VIAAIAHVAAPPQPDASIENLAIFGGPKLYETGTTDADSGWQYGKISMHLEGAAKGRPIFKI
jgi:hypothetical protein